MKQMIKRATITALGVVMAVLSLIAFSQLDIDKYNGNMAADDINQCFS